ncbi:hypothetical protein CCP2SC5_1160008 [Azospirillaceae bacterium]
MMLVNVSQIVIDLPEIADLELDPVIVDSDSLTVVRPVIEITSQIAAREAIGHSSLSQRDGRSHYARRWASGSLAANSAGGRPCI